MTQNEYAMCQAIAHFIEEDPSRFKMVQEAIHDGILSLNKKLIESKGDFEVVATMFAHTRLFKGNEKFIAQKIRKWHNQKFTSVEWTSILDKLDRET